ncbi:MAG: STAS-like domain-containing protein [Chloroflexi bacterium]|nr:STAS-like domain-containing protein [Chloroflexota bacterium]
MNYSIKENVGANGITLQDGQKVYDAIYPELKEKHKVTLDFAEVRIVASPFLNAAIGQLLRDLSPDDLNHYLKFVNLPPVTRPILKRVIDNAKEYYGSDQVRQAVDEAIGEEVNNTNGD